MPLSDAIFRDYDFDRMVVHFTMTNDGVAVPCAISTDAMDQMETGPRPRPHQREEQFLRLRDRIATRAVEKFTAVEFEGQPPGLILRAIDFRN